MTTHSGTSVAELVRLDLVHRENTGDLPSAFYTGSTAILDAYDLATDLCLYLRAVIESMQVGDGTLDRPLLPDPGFAAARQRTPEEEHGVALAWRKAVPTE